MDLVTKSEKEYSLIDSGEGTKLERFGSFIVVRPESQAIWPKAKPEVWQKADAIYDGDKWSYTKNTPKEIHFEFSGVKAVANLTKGRNIGVFPEYAGEWKMIENILNTRKNVKVLNLFAYTGLSSIICAIAGAQVVHVDSSQTSNEVAGNLAKENNVGDRIRFITEDALSFLKREVRRENKYDLIIMDPPVFGRGAKGQVFKLEDEVLSLVTEAQKLLSSDCLGIILNGYASEYSQESYKNILSVATGMNTVSGNLCIEEEGGRLKLPIAKWAFAFKNQDLQGIISAQINS